MVKKIKKIKEEKRQISFHLDKDLVSFLEDFSQSFFLKKSYSVFLKDFSYFFALRLKAFLNLYGKDSFSDLTVSQREALKKELLEFFDNYFSF